MTKGTKKAKKKQQQNIMRFWVEMTMTIKAELPNSTKTSERQLSKNAGWKKVDPYSS